MMSQTSATSVVNGGDGDRGGAGDHPLSAEDVQILEETVNLDTVQESGPSHLVHLIFARLFDTFFVWVGDPAAPVLNNVSLAIGKLMTTMESKQSNDQQSAADSSPDNWMASHLSVKFNGGRPVYVAYNYSLINSSNGGLLKLAVDKAVIAFVSRCLQGSPTSDSSAAVTKS